MADTIHVHVGLTPDAQRRLEDARSPARVSFARSLGLRRPDFDKLGMFGIVSGETERDALQKLRSDPAVDFVEADQERYAIGGGRP